MDAADGVCDTCDMAQLHRFEIATTGRGTYDVTREVARAVPRDLACGLAVVFCHHTSASLIVSENADPTVVNMALGVLSGILDNVPVEAAALMSNPQLSDDQWALNAMMVGIGGSLTVIGSAAGIMAMSLERTYTFATHLKFLPAILVNFFGSLGLWYLFFVEFGLGG